MEAAVRVVAPQPPSWLAIYRPHPHLPFFALQADVLATVDTGESRWTVRTDDQGFRVPRRPGTQDDRPTALWLGDSYTFGQGVEFEDSFVGLIASAQGSRLRHVNAGVGGYGPKQYRQTLEYLLGTGLRPRVVLIATFLGNDFFDCTWDKEYSIRDGILGNEGGVRSFLKLHFHLYRLASAALHRLWPPPVSQDLLDRKMADPIAWVGGELGEAERIYRREFERMADLCREHGIAMAVLIIPRATMVDAIAKSTTQGGDSGSDQELPLKHALAIFRDLGIRYLDLTPRLVQHPLGETYFHYDGHFTPRGHALAAEAMQREWGDLLLTR
jgi:hypothetical protein